MTDHHAYRIRINQLQHQESQDLAHWCWENVASSGWLHDRYEFSFANEGDLAAFVLTWG